MRVSVVLVAGLVDFTAGCAAAAPPPEPRASVPPSAPSRTAAATVPPNPKVGALFLGAGDLHTCTAGVLDSKGGDLILTAAHCVAEDIDTTFPGDIWRVDAIYLDPRWVQNQDPLADLAILRVSRDGGGTLETEAGGG